MDSKNHAGSRRPPPGTNAAPPYVVGQWVRGDRFYGRSALIDEILNGPRNWIWLLGVRRIGKTSLLKQIEWITDGATPREYLPVFWDFQGAATLSELHDSFSDALVDTEERLERLGIALDDVEHEDLFRSVNRLRRKLRSKGLRLMLLCDEVEELITLDRRHPTLLSKLRRLLQSHDNVRSVIASTIRLWDLSARQDDTSPFLNGFLPPLYIHNLSAEEARGLIRQVHLADESRPPFDDRTVETIRAYCDDHPYLIQMVCRRILQTGSVEEAVEQVANDPMISHFFAGDFEMLSQTERNIVRLVAQLTASTSRTVQARLQLDTDRLRGLMHRLEHLGYIRRGEDRQYVVVNYFFRRWFAGRPTSDGAYRTSARSGSDASAHHPTVDEFITSYSGPVAARRLAEDVRNLIDEKFSSEDAELLDGRYEIRVRIGEGATGAVYRAYDTLLRTDVAVKVLRPERTADPVAFERFRQELVLSREVSHPNLLRLYHLGQSDDRSYVTMKWVDGPTLTGVLREEGPLPVERVVIVAQKILGALAALHAHRLLHRDIKPGNILIDRESGEPFLSDFGLVRLIGKPGLTSNGIFLGTPEYASPEQVSGQPTDEQTDIYSFGVVLFEMCTGMRPFRDESRREVMRQHLEDPPPSPRDLRPDLPPELERVILSCLAKHPGDRPAGAETLRRTLQTIPG